MKTFTLPKVERLYLRRSCFCALDLLHTTVRVPYDLIDTFRASVITASGEIAVVIGEICLALVVYDTRVVSSAIASLMLHDDLAERPRSCR